MKKVLSYITVLLFGVLFILVGLKIFVNEVGVNLENTSQISAPIARVFETEKRNRRATVRLIAFTLDGLSETFAIRKSTVWAQTNLHIGDTITVNYWPVTSPELNVNVFQIAKGNSILMDYKQYERRHLILAVVLTALGFITVIVGSYKIRKSQY